MMRLFFLSTLCLILCASLANAQEICNNNLDDDGDGLVDCRDGDCGSKFCEICDNGMDDDGDGFVDCYDKECNLDIHCSEFFLGHDAQCEVPPETFPPFTMQLKWKSLPGLANHVNRLVAGDVDGDGLSELVTANMLKTGPTKDGVTAITASRVNIFGASTGTELNLKASIPVTMGGLEAVSYEDIATADINGDGCAEIFVVTKNLSTSANYKIVALDCNGARIWTTAVIAFDPGQFGLADFDGDGLVELYSRTQIFDAHTGVLLGSNNIDNVNTGIHAGVNKGWGMNSSAPVAVDILSANPGLELVAGCRIYSVSINRGAMSATLSLVREYAPYATRTVRGKNNPTSVADFNQDGYLDVLAVGSDGAYDDNTTIFFWDVQNNVVKKYIDLSGTGTYLRGWQHGASRINIADIDGDGSLNAVYVSGSFLYALTEGTSTLDMMWKTQVSDEGSGFTGCTTFDFNGDGKVEIVYRDENYLYIYHSENGGVQLASPVACPSRTQNEYPIVVDIDGDGAAELCVTCSISDATPGKDLGLFDEGEVRIYSSASEPWVPTRKVWNQHGYFVANVNDDLTIPRQQQLHHLVYAKNVPCLNGRDSRPLNSFNNQVPYLNSQGCINYPKPNLVPIPASITESIRYAPFTCMDDSIQITFKYKNVGDLSVYPGPLLRISFYEGDPTLQDPLAKLLGTKYFTVYGINPGDTIETTIRIKNPGGAFDLYIAVNDDGSTIPLDISVQPSHITECDYDNVISRHLALDPMSIGTEVIKNNVACLTAPGVPEVPPNGAVKAYISSGGVDNSFNYNFYWSNGPVPKPQASTDYIGQAYLGLPSGVYTVYAIHKTLNCASDAASVVVNEVSASVDAKVIQQKDFNDVTHPNGELRAIVNDTDNDGVGDPESNFNFAWHEGLDFLTTESIGNNSTLTGLGAGTFSVLVQDKSTGCYDSAYATIFRKEIVLGAEEGGDVAGVSMYPNPGTESLTIIIDNTYVGPVQLQVMSAVGSEVNRTFVSNKDTRKLSVPVDARKFKPGVYLVKISLGRETIVKKWTKL